MFWDCHIDAKGLTWPADWLDHASPTALIAQEEPKWSLSSHMTTSIAGSRTAQPSGSNSQPLRQTTRDQQVASVGVGSYSSVEGQWAYSTTPAD